MTYDFTDYLHHRTRLAITQSPAAPTAYYHHYRQPNHLADNNIREIQDWIDSSIFEALGVSAPLLFPEDYWDKVPQRATSEPC